MANPIKSRFIQGNLAFFGPNNRMRLLDAVGPDVIKEIDDFVRTPIASNALPGWTTTLVGASTITKLDQSGGWIRLTTAGAENDGVNSQITGEPFILKAGNRVYFGAFGVTISDATQSDFFLGLAGTDTAILGGTNSRIGFEKLDAATDIKAMLEAATVETLTASLHTLVAATAVDLEFYWDGAAATFFVNGVAVATPAATNVPVEEVTLSMEFLTGSANARTLDLDKLAVIQIGR